MYKHLEMIRKAGMDARMLSMFLQNEQNITAFYPELARSFDGIKRLANKKPPLLYWRMEYMHHLGDPKVSHSRYSVGGIASYELYEDAALVFGNDWLERPIRPFDIAVSIVESRPKTSKLERLDQSFHWPPFWQREKGKLAWIATKLLDDLRAPRDICPCCGRGGDLEPIRCNLKLFGIVWGAGEECIGDGYIILSTTHRATEKSGL